MSATAFTRTPQDVQIIFFITRRSDGALEPPSFFLDQMADRQFRAYFIAAVHNISSAVAGYPSCYVATTAAPPSTSLTTTSKYGLLVVNDFSTTNI